MRKLSGINFNFTYRLHLVLVIRIWLSRSTSSKNPDQTKIILISSNLLIMFNTKYYIKYSSKYTNSCYIFFFLHNFKLKTEVIINKKSLLVAELNKFELQDYYIFTKGFYNLMWLNYLFKNFSMFKRICLLYKGKRLICWH